MNSDKNEAEKLPDGWILCQSKSNPGRKYYFNKKTGKSSWTTPQVEDKHDSTQKCKKERVKEKSKKEEQRKNLKRKSEGNDDSLSRKKQKQDTPSPEKHKSLASKTDSPTKTPNLSKNESPIKPTSAKNLANTRLSLLRAQLHSDIQSLSNDETEKSPTKLSKNKISPKTPQTPKVDLKSPNLVDSKCSLNHSPSSDSVQSMPSPSQFLAANKIISSMKAQLPDEYCNKLKPKDTFADIEQGICSQTAEYPSMKHPATPPQFSEASKLVSAIKSRLSYKVATKDVNIKTFSSAKDRMEALRSRLSNEGDTRDEEISLVSEISDSNFINEAMEVEDCKEVKSEVPSLHCTKDVGSKDNVILVVDTNVFIHELDVIKNVINSHIKGYAEQPTLLVPWRVVNELDRLKDNNNGNGAICKRARAAMDYLYKSLPENNRIKGQSLRDANSHIYPCESPDDEILNCCLQQADRGISVVLVSNDKNLCNKALLNGVKCIALPDLKSLIEYKPQPTVDPDLYVSVKVYEDTMYQLLANILENEMRAKYNNLWQHIVFKAPPWTLEDTLQCLLKHWVAVFSEVFPRIEHLITDLRNAQVEIHTKDPQSLSQSEVANFKELCLDVAKKCQIIPEYMELAKVTVERLSRASASETDSARRGNASETDSAGRGNASEPVEPQASELPVIEAFEGLWTVFSSYCAKLSNALGVPHNVEDKLPGQESWSSLTGKWITFNKYINALADTMRGALGTDVSDPEMEEHVSILQTVFKESLTAVSLDGSVVSRDSMRIFCTNCRNMLEEAYTKFSELSEILTACQNNMANK